MRLPVNSTAMPAEVAAVVTLLTPGEEMSGNVTVRIDNTYVCGRSSGGEHQVPAPEFNVSEEGLDDWWEEHVQPLTGDGHPCAAGEHSLYEATITAAHGRPELIGQTWTAEDQ